MSAIPGLPPANPIPAARRAVAPGAAPMLAGALPQRRRRWSLPAALCHFQGLAGDFAGRSGKVVEVTIEAPAIELPTVVIEAVIPALVQLLRNAVAHGIETPMARIAAGKPAAGRIAIAARSIGRQLSFEITDDGRGIDPDEVAAAAVAAGLIGPQEAAGLGADALQGLVFWPGLTLARGSAGGTYRGHGLATVEARLALLGGGVSFVSTPGHGSTFCVALPLRQPVVEPIADNNQEAAGPVLAAVAAGR